MQLTTRQLAYYVGSALSIAGVVFVSYKLYDFRHQLDFARLTTHILVLMAGMVLVYAAGGLLLAHAWRNLLSHLGSHTQSLWAIKTYGSSQLSKYVPGNIMQFVGRQAMGMAAGVNSWALAKSSVWEIGLLAVTGTLFIPQLLPYLGLAPDSHLLPFFLIALPIVILCVVYKYISHNLALALLYQFIFLCMSGSIFLTMMMALGTPVEWHTGFYFVAAYVVGWLCGLVTPGAPAGLGVREAVVVYLFQGMVNEADIFLAVVLVRLVNIVGDVLFFLMACTLAYKPTQAEIDTPP